MAHETENESHKNDFTGVYLKKGTPADTIAFEMVDCEGEIVSNEGEEAVFPNDSLAAGYIYNWKTILSTHGVGNYSIKVNFTIAGVSDTILLGSYELKVFSVENAKDSVRIYSEFNSYYLRDDVDFTNSNFKDAIRFNGFFGNREPETDINNLIGKGRKVLKVTRENLNKYTLSTDPIKICMSSQILDKHLVNEDVTKISDYNRFNHDFTIFDKEVVLIDTPTTEYIEKDRRVQIIAIFGDRKQQDRSYFR